MHLTAKHSGRQWHLDGHAQRRSLARKALIWRNMYAQVEIAAPRCALTALTRDTDARTLVHSGRNLHFETFRTAIDIRQFQDTRSSAIGFRQRHLNSGLYILSYGSALARATRRSC